MMKFTLLFLFITFQAFVFGQEPLSYRGVALYSGDLVFVGAQREHLSGAINRVTQRTADVSFDHVGLIELAEGQPYVLHATGSKGSVREPLDSLLKRGEQKETTFVVYRVSEVFRAAIPEAIERARSMLGKPYNWSYVLNDTSYYCSDFVERAFRPVSLFSLEPMTFVNPQTGKVDDFWLVFYEKLGIEMPEGKLGCNPNGLAANEHVQRIGVFQ